MPSNSIERRKGLRSNLLARFGFNILKDKEGYIRGQTSVIKQLLSLNEDVMPEPTNNSQHYLARIDAKLSILISMFAKHNSPKNYLHQGQVSDISEFGLSFISSTELTLGSYLEIGLMLPNQGNNALDICGWIVRVRPHEKNTNKNIYGLEFQDILTSDQDDIIQWIFQKQRDDIRRRRETEVS